MTEVSELTVPSDQSFHANQRQCQEFIRNECKVGDSILVTPFGGGEGVLCKIVHINIQSVEAIDEFGTIIQNIVYKDDARLGSSQFLGAVNSFDHTEEAKILRSIAKSGGIPDYTDIKNEVMQSMQQEFDALKTEHESLVKRVTQLEQGNVQISNVLIELGNRIDQASTTPSKPKPTPASKPKPATKTK